MPRFRTIGQVLAGIVVFACLSSPQARAEDMMSGHATVVDGQHLKIDGKTVSLYGVDAPALDATCLEWRGTSQISYPCGEHAKAFLASIAAARDFVCVKAAGGEPDQVTCYADGRDVAETMVEAGWAVACGYASRYVRQATGARTARVGLWAGNFKLAGQCQVAALPNDDTPADQPNNLPPASTFKGNP
jgi:endonuclease YncB( thermonuclease family)